jgi:putative endonuclease
MKRGVLYILQSQITSKFYIGSTFDLTQRLLDHKRGNTKTTRIHKPWALVYSENFDTLSQARSREKQLKKWKSHVRVQSLIDRYNSAEIGREAPTS